jgi:hypothetical protein
LEVWANNGGGFVGIDVDIIGNQIGGNWLGLQDYPVRLNAK